MENRSRKVKVKRRFSWVLSGLLLALLFGLPASSWGDASSNPKTLGQVLFEHGGKLPTPFDQLIQASGGSEENVILIPRGRSIVADQTDFGHPRVLLSPSSTSQDVPAKLFIGYTPKTDSLEIAAWNPAKKQYDFLVVSDYSKPAKQVIARAPEGKCTVCHVNHTLLFAPTPWGEVTDFMPFNQNKPRPRMTAVKVADALKNTPGYPEYYGIDLEKYKTAVSRRVLTFFVSVTRSMISQRNGEVCSMLCHSGDAASNQQCRRTVAANSVRRLLAFSGDSSEQQSLNSSLNALLSPQGSGLSSDPALSSLFSREKIALVGKLAAANDPIIPDRDPETGDLYRVAETPEEKQKIKRESSIPKVGATDGLIPGTAFKIKLTKAERNGYQIGEHLKTTSPVTEVEVAQSLATGCLNFSPSETKGILALDIGRLKNDLLHGSDPGLEAALRKGLDDPAALTSAFLDSQGKKGSIVTDEQAACLPLVESVLGGAHQTSLNSVQVEILRTLPLKGQGASFKMYCVYCHTGSEGDPPALPFEALIANPNAPNQNAAFRNKMTQYLSHCVMPPKDASPKLPNDLRAKMLESLGSPAGNELNCP